MSVSGFSSHYEFVLEQEHLPSGRQESKNRDKQLTFIARVIRRFIEDF
jgi:hypothetical protein